MPRFFFHNRNQDQTYLDPEGSDLPDLAAAMAEATRSAREMMADELRRGPLTPGRNFDIVGRRWCGAGHHRIPRLPL